MASPQFQLPKPTFEPDGDFVRLLMQRALPQNDFYNLLQRNVDLNLADIQAAFEAGEGTVGPKVARPTSLKSLPKEVMRGINWSGLLQSLAITLGTWAGEIARDELGKYPQDSKEHEIAECVRVGLDVMTDVLPEVRTRVERKQTRRRRKSKDPRRRVRIWGYSRCN